MSERRAFLRDQFHGLVLQATVQRADIYAFEAPEDVRQGFRIGLRRALDAAAVKYANPVPDDAHIAEIVALADELSTTHGEALSSQRFRIGPAQKALNLFLKYLWCTDEIPTPPHCPFDSFIIGELPVRCRVNWTEMDEREQYERLVEGARERAGDQSLAEWELRLYDEISARREGLVPPRRSS